MNELLQYELLILVQVHIDIIFSGEIIMDFCHVWMAIYAKDFHDERVHDER